MTASLAGFGVLAASVIPSLEEFLTSPEWFGLTTASPLQRAICRILDGIPLGDLARDADVIGALGGVTAIEQLPAARCAELVLLAGIRSGKSLLATAVIVRAALTCDTKKMRHGEVATASVVSLNTKQAKKTFSHAIGSVRNSSRLRAMLVGPPLTESFTLRHPSGQHIQVCVVAGAAAAANLISDWSAGVVFDEATRMLGEEEAVVNLDDARTAIAGRMLDGAQVIMAGSAWQPYGPVFDLVKDHHGKPTENLVVVRATGPAMNPREWTPERCEKLKKKSPDAYKSDVLTEFVDPESGIFGEGELRLCARAEMVALPVEGRHYTAAMDAGQSGNSWTFVIGSLEDERKLSIDLAVQWTGSTSEPTNAHETFKEIAALGAPYGVKTVLCDEWSANALQEIAAKFGLWLTAKNMTRGEKNEGMRVLRDLRTESLLSIPSNETLMRDLHTAKYRVDEQGKKVHLPQTRDGRHCDYIPPLLKIAISYMREPDAPATPPPETEAGQLALRAAEKEAARQAVVARIHREEKGMRRHFFGR